MLKSVSFPALSAIALGAGLAFTLPPAVAMAEVSAAEINAETPEASLPAITVSTVGKRVLTDTIYASGLIAPAETVLVAPLVEGQQIEALMVQVGDMVTEGQVLARLSNATLTLQKDQLDASLQAARSNAGEADKSAKRVASLFEQGSASNTANDQARAAATAAGAQLSQIESQLANVELMLSRTEVKAPVAGLISARNAQLGAIASAAAQPMFTIIRDGALELRVDVSQADMTRLAVGQPVSLRGAGDGDFITGKVALVEPIIDPQTRLGRVRISAPADVRVRSGMFMEARIEASSREVVAVPVSAIGASAAGLNVMRFADGHLTQVAVKTGIREGKWIEVTEGLAAGDTVVTKAGAFVRNGDKINPIPAPPEEDASN
jgi:HlyD family secretion protein